MLKLIVLVIVLGNCSAYPEFLTKYFKVGIEYEHSLPMSADSSRYRHKNNYEPFYVTITATSRKGYVLDFLEVSAVVDPLGDVEFRLVQGQAGNTKMTFQLISNNSDFLLYTYRSYGIKEEDYRKMANHIILPLNKASKIHAQNYLLLFIVLFCTLFSFYFQ